MSTPPSLALAVPELYAEQELADAIELLSEGGSRGTSGASKGERADRWLDRSPRRPARLCETD